ncbi:MAG: T9SS type A sorting domain-containing protein, partial [Bacteroidales bacterium]|nr:T9SS type A sorting domain-containing protein [Bacteroidales bacterium]
KTISDVPNGISVSTFEGNLVPAEGASIKTYQSDGTTEATELSEGCKLIVTAEDGNNTNTYTIEVVVGIDAHINDAVLIYPNPASDYLTIEGKDNSRIEIFSILGTKVLDDVVTGSLYSVSIGGIKPGIYVIRLRNEESIKYSRFLKK